LTQLSGRAAEAQRYVASSLDDSLDMNRKLIPPVISIILFSALSLGCQEHMTIKMRPAVPPVFTFQASRFTHFKHLSFFIVIELAPGNEKIPAYESPPVENKTIWWLFPEDSERSGYENLPEFTYGTVPHGWTQKTPDRGVPPPALVEGKFYEAGGPQIEVPWGHMRFTIRNGKAVRVPLYREEFQK
jgi:hypothetical protein